MYRTTRRGAAGEPRDVGGSLGLGSFPRWPSPVGVSDVNHFYVSCVCGFSCFLLGWMLTAEVISSLSTYLQTKALGLSWKPELQAQDLVVCPGGGAVVQGTAPQEVGVPLPLLSMESFGRGEGLRTGERTGYRLQQRQCRQVQPTGRLAGVPFPS